MTSPAPTPTPRPRGTPARTPFESGDGGVVDVMGGDARRQINVLDHGFVALIDAMPRLVPAGQTADSAIVQAARVSYGAGTKKVSEDRGLVRYLLRHRHTTPFEMVEFKFHVAMPIFIARQWIRHRMASVNEYSGRYSVMPDTFYRPSVDKVRKQSASNRQGSESLFDLSVPAEAATANAFVEYLQESERLYAKYAGLSAPQRLDDGTEVAGSGGGGVGGGGVARELARIGLPVSQYTQWYWKIDLHNLLRFLSLRLDGHAQEEIRVYAQAIHDLVEPIVPVTLEAWRDYEVEGLHLTRLEVEALRSQLEGHKGTDRAMGEGGLRSDNRREQAEWAAKRERLGL